MGLPTSEMQADFHPPPKLGLAYVLYGLGESKDRDSCHPGMLLRTGVFPGPGLCVHGSLMVRTALSRVLVQLLNDLWASVSSSVKWVNNLISFKDYQTRSTVHIVVC